MDFRKLALLLIPTFLRHPTLVALLQVLMHPLDALHSTFLDKRKADFERLALTPQVCSIRHALNEAYDLIRAPQNQQFDVIDTDHDALYRFAYNRTQWLDSNDRVWMLPSDPDATIIYDASLIDEPQYAFVVLVPQAISVVTDRRPEDHRIEAIVNSMRLVSRTPTYRQI